MTKPNGHDTVKTLALYARVSTTDKGQDPEMQLRELRDYARLHNLTVFREYVDSGISGSKDSRPQLNALMVDAQARKFDAVAVWKLDRFSRSLRMLINSLEVLAGAQVSFISLRDNLDLTTPAGRLMFQMIGAFAEFEREIIRERVRAGLRNARAKGKRLGRKPKKAMRSGDAKRILEMRAAGMTFREIARETGFTLSMCHRSLSQNPAESSMFQE